MADALSIMTTTIPMVLATAGVSHVVQVAMKKNGKSVGQTHYHYRGKKVMSHKHEGGHLSHSHRGLSGYGRTRKSLQRF